MSSISPWRQFLPSTLEIDAMFPAPKASAPEGSNTRIAIATSSRYFDETPMMCDMGEEIVGSSDVEKKSSKTRSGLFARAVQSAVDVTGKGCACRHTSTLEGGVHNHVGNSCRNHSFANFNILCCRFWADLFSARYCRVNEALLHHGTVDCATLAPPWVCMTMEGWVCRDIPAEPYAPIMLMLTQMNDQWVNRYKHGLPSRFLVQPTLCGCIVVLLPYT